MLYKISSSFPGLAGRFKVLMIWGALVGISACSILASPKGDPNLAVPKSFSPKWPGLVLSASADVNVNSAVAVDIGADTCPVIRATNLSGLPAPRHIDLSGSVNHSVFHHRVGVV